MLGLTESHDIFVSYSRADASAYADGLVEALLRCGFSVYFDRLGSEPKAKLPAGLVRTLIKTSMLVLIASPGAKNSSAIKKEVELFLQYRGGERVIVIDFDENAQHARFYPLIVGLAREAENLAALQDGSVSSQVVERIKRAFVYRRTKDKNQRNSNIAATILAILLLAVVATTILLNERISQITSLSSQSQRLKRDVESAKLAASAAKNEVNALTEKAISLESRVKLAMKRALQASEMADQQERVARSRTLAGGER